MCKLPGGRLASAYMFSCCVQKLMRQPCLHTVVLAAFCLRIPAIVVVTVAAVMHVRPTRFSVGGTGKKSQKNRYHYELILPSKGVYTANRTDSNPFWLWQADSGTWFAGPELSLPLDSATQEFDDQLVDVQWMCKGQVTQPGVHNWFQWVEKHEDWAREPCEFVTEIDEAFPVDRTHLPPGVAPRHGWYDPSRPVVDDDLLKNRIGSDFMADDDPPPPRRPPSPLPLTGVWEPVPSPPSSPRQPPPKQPRPDECRPPLRHRPRPPPGPPPPPKPSLPVEGAVKAPTTPPEAFQRPKAVPFSVFQGSSQPQGGGVSLSPAQTGRRWGRSRDTGSDAWNRQAGQGNAQDPGGSTQ